MAILAKKLKMKTSKKKGVLHVHRKLTGKLVLKARIPASLLSAKGSVKKSEAAAYAKFRAEAIERAQLKLQARKNKRCGSKRAYCAGTAYHTAGSKRCCPKGGKKAVKKGKKGGAFAEVAGKRVALVRVHPKH